MERFSQIIVEEKNLIDLPSLLYKYRAWSDVYHKRFITHNEVFMASASTFEDELDCRNPTRFDLLTNQDIYDFYLQSSKNKNTNYSHQEHCKFARDWSVKSAVRDPKILKKWTEETLQKYYNHEGILSLTENWNNDLMWEKYADNSKGFCIGYNTKELFKYLGGGSAVEYVDELPIVYPLPFMSFEVSSSNRVYYKTRKWDFEQEYRTKMFWPNIAQIEDRQIKLPQEAYNKVILGDNISDLDKREIIKNVKEHIGDIEIIERKSFANLL